MRLRILIAIVLFTLKGNVIAQSPTDSCKMPGLPLIHFNKTVFLSKKAKLQLDSVVKIAEQYPFCKIKVTGHAPATYQGQQDSWDQVYSIVTYLLKRRFNKDRLIFEYGTWGDPSNIEIIGSRKDGYPLIPSPHPQLSHHPSERNRYKN